MTKSLFLLATIITFLSCNTDDDATPESTFLDGDLEIRSQADLDDPNIQNYKTIGGNLVVHYTENVKEVQGSIIIS